MNHPFVQRKKERKKERKTPHTNASIQNEVSVARQVSQIQHIVLIVLGVQFYQPFIKAMLH